MLLFEDGAIVEAEERKKFVHRDSKGRKHCATGPAVADHYGSEYWVHGFRVYNQEHFMEMINKHGTEKDREDVLFAILEDDMFLKAIDYSHDGWDGWDCVEEYAAEYECSFETTIEGTLDMQSEGIEELLHKKRTHKCLTRI